MVEGKLDCIAGKLLKTALEKEAINYRVEELPWARAQAKMAKNANSLFASTGRNKYTEDKFSWFFKVYSDDVNIFTNSSNKINNKKELSQKVKTVAVRIGSPFFPYAKDLNIRVSEVTEWYLGARQVKKNRVDGMLLTTLVGEENFFKIEKMNRNEINRFKIGEMQWYFVRPKDAPLTPELIKLAHALKKVKDSAEFQSLLKSRGVHW